ncbi:TPA: hypothetical protein ACGO1T_001035 [Streptococcus suis]
MFLDRILLGRRIAEVLKESDISVESLAETLGVKLWNVDNWIKGNLAIPKKYLKAIAWLTGVEEKQLTDRAFLIRLSDLHAYIEEHYTHYPATGEYTAGRNSAYHDLKLWLDAKEAQAWKERV